MNSTKHTIERINERYNLQITQDDYNILCQKFINNECIIISEEKSNNQTIFQTTFKNKTMNLVWCHKRKLITTAIPLRNTIGSGSNTTSAEIAEKITRGLVNKLDWNMSQEEYDLAKEYIANFLLSQPTIIRPGIKAMQTAEIITLQHELANSKDETDKQFRHELLVELGIREKTIESK